MARPTPTAASASTQSRTSSARFLEVYALAAAPGSGVGWVALNPDAEQPAAEIRLQPEQVIRGKLVDVNGQPAAGVEVQVHHRGPLDRQRTASTASVRLLGGSTLPRDSGLAEARHHRRPGPVHIRRHRPGLSRSALVRPRPPLRPPETRPPDRRSRWPKEVALALQPATIIEGRVLAADTGQPIPDAVIAVRASYGMFGGMVHDQVPRRRSGTVHGQPLPGRLLPHECLPPEGQPYLVREDEFAWTKGAVKKEIDIKLPRGVLIRGKVTEEGTGRPVAGASVQFFPRNSPRDILDGWEAIVASKDDGSFQIAVPPGKGYLLVLGPTLDYILEEIGGGMLYERVSPAGCAIYAHDIIAYEVKAGDRSSRDQRRAAAGQDRRGPRGRPGGADGRGRGDPHPAPHRSLQPHLVARATAHAPRPRRPLRAARARPGEGRAGLFPRRRHQWGAAVELSGKQAGEELTIRLQPCGQAKARFVGPDGKPVAKLSTFPFFELLITPGRHDMARDKAGRPSWRPTRRSCPTSTPSTIRAHEAPSPTPTAASPCPT